jgi:hypothetical protein
MRALSGGIMRVPTIVLAIVCLAAPATGCSKPEDQRAAETAAKQLEEAAKAVESGDTAKGLEDMGKALGALTGGATEDGKPVQPVSFRDLQTVFPDVAGWQREKPTGQRMNMPVAFSEAEVHYSKDGATVELKIMDSGLNQILIAPFSAFLQAGYEQETESGYERSLTVGGYPGWEQFESGSNHGQLNALVGKRFVVSIAGDGIEDTKILHEFAGRIDLKKLEGLK